MILNSSKILDRMGKYEYPILTYDFKGVKTVLYLATNGQMSRYNAVIEDTIKNMRIRADITFQYYPDRRVCYTLKDAITDEFVGYDNISVKKNIREICKAIAIFHKYEHYDRLH